VVIVLPPKNVHMQRHAGGHCERVEDVRDHFCGEVPNFFAIEAEGGDAVGAGTYVYYCSGQCLGVRRRG
jgi:hypothetical protein